MSMSSVNPQPPEGGALQKAIQEYVSKLSDDDKEAFKSAPDIIGRLQEMQRNSKSPISNSLMTRVERVLQCIKNFMSSLAIFIQQNPEISSLVVGGVSCILTLVLGYIEFFERLTAMMERIGTHLSYLTEYSRATFQDSEKLQKALVATYCDLLEFYVKSRQVFTNKKGKPSYVLGFRLFFKHTWEPFEAQFDSIEAKFSNHVLILIRLANVDYQIRTLAYHDEIRRLEEKKEENETRRNILRWLSRDDFEETFERHFKTRFKNTGQWLLDHPRFINWRDGVQSSLLWCHGAPGSGKTILASLVIEHLSALYDLSTDTAITFVYCNYKEPRTTTAYICPALKQLCQNMQSLPSTLQEVYKQHYKNDRRPKYDELRNIFLTIIQQLGHVFFVVDALDECTLEERKNLCEFFLSIINTGTSQGTVKLFITSRQEPDIEQAFRQKAIPIIKIEAAKVDKDIEIYVKAQVKLRLDNGSLRIRNIVLADKIVSALTTKAGGMFLWVKFQLDAICAEHSDKGIEKALTRVPEDMNATYERILMNINGKPGTQRELARKVLIWTAYARQLLSIDTLAYAISIERDTQSLEDLESSIPTQKNILDACANLISIDQGSSQYARFVHFSVQEFLTCGQSTYIDSLGIGHEVAHREIAQSCMIFLTLLSPQIFPSEPGYDYLPDSPPSDSEPWYDDLLDSPPSDPWHHYAFYEWPHHLLAGDLNSQQVDDQIVTLAVSFFDTKPLVLIRQPTILNHPRFLQRFYLKLSPPVLALIFHLPSTPKCRLSHRNRSVEEQSGIIEHSNDSCIILSDDKLAMHYAAAELDSVPVARRLYNYGLPGNYTYWGKDKRVPLLYSVQSGQMARFLLDNVTSMEVGTHMDPLRGEIDPLIFFTGKRNLGAEVLQVLVDRLGVVDQNRERFGRVLRFAANIGNLDAIQLLLNKGAGINSLDESDGSALQIATLNEEVEVIQLLLDRGADVNIKGGFYGCALQAAAFNGSIKVIQLLLDKGADVNIKGGKYGYALQAAAFKGNIKVAQLLLDKGADVNIQGGEYGNALQAAIRGYNIEVIQLLLDKGADVNVQGGEYGNALQAAARGCSVEVIQLLLDKGADVNVQGGEYGNALQAAAWRRNVEVIQLLLDKGADVNIQGGKYGNALQAAAWLCCDGIEAIRLLLDNGADVHAQGGIYGTALQAALAPKYEKRGKADIILSAVRLLLDYGANSSTYVPESEFGDALTAARRLWEDDDDRNHLDTTMELLAPGGLKTDLALRERKRNLAPQGKRDEAESIENSLEDAQESKRRRI